MLRPREPQPFGDTTAYADEPASDFGSTTPSRRRLSAARQRRPRQPLAAATTPGGTRRHRLNPSPGQRRSRTAEPAGGSFAPQPSQPESIRSAACRQRHSDARADRHHGRLFLRRHQLLLAELGAARHRRTEAHRHAALLLGSRTGRIPRARRHRSSSPRRAIPELYCAEAPITLVNIDEERIAQARAAAAGDRPADCSSRSRRKG